MMSALMARRCGTAQQAEKYMPLPQGHNGCSLESFMDKVFMIYVVFASELLCRQLHTAAIVKSFWPVDAVCRAELLCCFNYDFSQARGAQMPGSIGPQHLSGS
jgi:hypothetical protein